MPLLLVFVVLLGLAVSGCPKVERYLDKIESDLERGPVAEDRQGREMEAMTHFSYAQALALEGRRGQAIDELLLALKADPDSAYLRIILAYNLMEEGRLVEAQKWAEEAVDLAPQSAEAHYVLGLVLMEQEKFAEAEEKISRAASLDSDNAEYVIQLADIMLQQGKVNPALLALEDFSKRHPDELLVRYYVAAILRRAGDRDEAAARFQEILERSPSFYPALYDLVRLQAERGEIDKAIEAGYALISFFPADSDSRKMLSKLLVKTGREEEALDVLEGGKAVGGPDAVWSLRKGFILLDLERTEAARQEFDSALQTEPESTAAVYGLGLVEMREGNETEALTYLESVPPDSKFYFSARRMIIISALKKDNTKQAKEMARDFYKRNPKNLNIIKLYVFTLRENNDYEEAERLLQKLLKKLPDREDLHLDLALTYSVAGEDDKAVAVMQDYLEKDPESAPALNFIGYTWAEQGIKLDEAEDMVRRALELSPHSGYIMDSLGWVYYQKKDYKKALEWLKKADEAQGPDPEILFHLGDCYRALGREDKARESYRQAIEESVSPNLRGRIKSRLEDVR